MNKLLTKVARLALGLSLAAGVGVAIGSKAAERADASAGTSATGNWTPITSTSDINTTDDFLLAYSGSQTYYGTGTVSSKALTVSSTLSNAKTVQFVSTTGGYYIKISSTNYLNNTASKTDMTSTTSGSSVWTINSTDLCVENTSNSNRFLGGASDGGNIKAYASSNKASYPNVHVYKKTQAVQTYTVTYTATDATSGTVPTDGNSYNSGATVTVLGNTGNLTRTGWTFAGWSNGTTTYAAGDTFSIAGNITLHAVWSYNNRYTDDTSNNTITWDLTNPEHESATASAMSWTSSKATMASAKGSSNTAANNYCPPAQSSTRFYTDHSLTITPVSGYKINSIDFACTTEGYATTLANSTWTNGTATATSTDVDVALTDPSNAVSVTFTNTVGVSTIVVHYAQNATLSSIVVSGSMTNTTYSVGGSWDPTGLVVTATYSDDSTATVTTAVSWTYSPASPTSTSVTSVVATASYTEGGVTKTANSSAQVVTVSNETSDVITVADTSATGTSYVATTGITKNTAVYSSQNAKAEAANGGGLQYRSNNNNSGIVSTTSGGLIKSVSIAYPEGKSGQMDIYGKNSAYTAPSDLYSDSTAGTLLGSISTSGTLNVTGDYQYVGVRSSSGSRYLTSISFVWVPYDASAPSIQIDQSTITTDIGGSGTLTATVANAGGNTVSWSSSDSTIVSINSSTGAWEAHKTGAATITATLGSTGKTSIVVIGVSGSGNVADARDLIDALGGGDAPYHFTVSGYVVSASGDGTKDKNNSIYIADEKSGTTQLQIFFGYTAVTNWATLSVVDTKIQATGTLTLYNTTYELKNPTNLQVVDEDKAAVQEFVEYLHMTSYTTNSGYCKDNEHHYYLTAKAAYNDLIYGNATRENYFATDSDFAAAKARYEAWAAANGDLAPYDGNDDIQSMRSSLLGIGTNVENTNTIAIIVIISMVSVTAIGGYFFIKRRKVN